MTDLVAAWNDVHDGKPDGRFVGTPVYIERRGWEQYAFDTRERAKAGHRSREWTAVAQSELDVVALRMRSLSETYDHIGTVPVWAHDLDRRWAEEESRTRVIIDGRSSFKEISIPTKAPPQVTWEFVTTPGRRVLWQVGVTGVEVTATGKEAELERLRPEADVEPESPTPRPNGPLAGIAPASLRPATIRASPASRACPHLSAAFMI